MVDWLPGLEEVLRTRWEPARQTSNQVTEFSYAYGDALRHLSLCSCRDNDDGCLTAHRSLDRGGGGAMSVLTMILKSGLVFLAHPSCLIRSFLRLHIFEIGVCDALSVSRILLHPMGYANALYNFDGDESDVAISNAIEASLNDDETL